MNSIELNISITGIRVIILGLGEEGNNYLTHREDRDNEF